MIYYISFLLLEEGAHEEIFHSFKKYIFKQSKIKVAVIRYILTVDEAKKLKKIDPSLHEECYDVLAIDLWDDKSNFHVEYFN